MKNIKSKLSSLNRERMPRVLLDWANLTYLQGEKKWSGHRQKTKANRIHFFLNVIIGEPLKNSSKISINRRKGKQKLFSFGINPFNYRKWQKRLFSSVFMYLLRNELLIVSLVYNNIFSWNRVDRPYDFFQQLMIQKRSA